MMTAKNLFILNGPNLDMLGVREPEIYGSQTLADIETLCQAACDRHGITMTFRQTNHEGVMVDWLHEAYHKDAVVICNPAGLSFHSVAMLDALKILKRPYYEVHISNIHRRDDQHRHSLTANASTAVLCGFGSFGYIMAIEAAAALA